MVQFMGRLLGTTVMDRLSALLAVAIGLCLAGCSPAYQEPRLAADHPASPAAKGAALPERSGVLDAGAPGAGGTLSAPTGHQHGDAARAGEHEHAGHGHAAAPAPAPSSDSGKPAASSGEAAYVCPMHPDVTASAPGRCPKCGMQLVKREGAKP